MKLWLDEHLSPLLAAWITSSFGIEAEHVRNLNLERAPDRDVFGAARSANAVLITKDADFAGILERFGPPPRIIWLTCGNTSNANLKRLLARSLRQSIDAIEAGEAIVEIG